MVCAKCKSENVTVSVVNDVKLKTKHHSIIWWLVVGWWWIPVKWIFLTIPALFAAIFIPKRQKAVNVTKKVYVCQDCGHTWS